LIADRLGEKHAGLELRLLTAALLPGGRRRVELMSAELLMDDQRVVAGRGPRLAAGQRGAELDRRRQAAAQLLKPSGRRRRCS
jgi:hypothetical protein